MFDASTMRDASDEWRVGARGSELRPSIYVSFICAGSKFQTNNGNPNFAQLGPVPLGKLKNAYYKKIIMAPLTVRHPKNLKCLYQRIK